MSTTQKSNFDLLRVGLFFLFFVFLTVFSLRFDPDLKDLDDGVYSNYLTSLVMDGDLNVVDQLPAEKRWMVSKKLNHPTLHDHGISIFWVPTYLYARILKSMGVNIKYENQRTFRTAMVISNTFYFLLVIILGLKIFPLFWNRAIEPIELGALVFGTPFFWYGLVQPSSADVTSAAIPFFLILNHIFLMKKPKELSIYLSYGALISIGIILKISLLFYTLLPLHLIYFHYKLNKFEIKNFLLLALGSLVPLLFFILNEYIKYGRVGYSYSGIVGPYNVLWEILLGPAGYLVVSPLFLVAAVSSFSLKNLETKRSLVLLLILIPLIKILGESYSFQGNADFGGRHLITDFAIFLLLLPCLFTSIQNKYFKYSILLYCILHTQMMVSNFYVGIENKNYTWGALYENPFSSFLLMWPKYKYFFYRFFTGFFDSSFLEVLKFFPVFIFGGWVFKKVLDLDLTSDRVLKSICQRVAIGTVIIYGGITVVNSVFNPKNVEEMRKNNFYEKLIVVDGPEAYYFYDNVSNIFMHKKFSLLRGDQKSVELADLALKKYYQTVQEQILVDPVGLKEKLRSGEVEFPDPFYGTNDSL